MQFREYDGVRGGERETDPRGGDAQQRQTDIWLGLKLLHQALTQGGGRGSIDSNVRGSFVFFGQRRLDLVQHGLVVSKDQHFRVGSR